MAALVNVSGSASLVQFCASLCALSRFCLATATRRFSSALTQLSAQNASLPGSVSVSTCVLRVCVLMKSCGPGFNTLFIVLRTDSSSEYPDRTGLQPQDETLQKRHCFREYRDWHKMCPEFFFTLLKRGSQDKYHPGSWRQKGGRRRLAAIFSAQCNSFSSAHR